MTTGAHQTEGNNLAGDWWALENAPDTVPLTTLFWAGTGDRLGHEYRFNFDLRRPAPPSSGPSISSPPSPKAEPVPEPAAARRPAPHPRRAVRIASRTGWVLLALVSMALTYGALVVAGR